MTTGPKSKFYGLIGIGGVHHLENQRAQFWGNVFEWPMILLAVWILFLWHFQNIGYAEPSFARITDLVIWLFFVLEFAVLSSLCDKKWRYVRANWLNLVIIVAGVSILWGDHSYAALLRGLRLIIMLTLLISVFESIREVLARNQLGMTLIISLFLILIAGVLVAGFDPAVENPWIGIWWAWVTVTTVGYGDVVPASVIGKVLGGILILMGVGLFSLLTASFSALFVSRGEKSLQVKEEQALAELQKMNQILDNLEQRLKNIEHMQTLHKDQSSPDSSSSTGP